MRKTMREQLKEQGFKSSESPEGKAIKKIKSIIKEAENSSVEKALRELKELEVKPEQRTATKEKSRSLLSAEDKGAGTKKKNKPPEGTFSPSPDSLKLASLDDELAKLKKELDNISSINPEEMMFKGLSTERQRRKVHEGMLTEAQKRYNKKKKEVDKLKEKVEAEKQLKEKTKLLGEYQMGLEKAQMSFKPMESAYFQDLSEKTTKEVKQLNKKIKGGFWKRLFGTLRGTK